LSSELNDKKELELLGLGIALPFTIEGISIGVMIYRGISILSAASKFMVGIGFAVGLAINVIVHYSVKYVMK
jgi:hypothetical protein